MQVKSFLHRCSGVRLSNKSPHTFLYKGKFIQNFKNLFKEISLTWKTVTVHIEFVTKRGRHTLISHQECETAEELVLRQEMAQWFKLSWCC